MARRYRWVQLGLITVLAGCDGEDPEASGFRHGGHGHHHGPLVRPNNPARQATYRELAAQWTSWGLTLPWSTGPILDTDGSACALGQTGDTWFLAGTAGGEVERTCTIPEGTRLFFPLVNYWVSPRLVSVDTPEEMASVQSFIEEYFPYKRESTCGLTLRVDGEEVLPDFASLESELYSEVLEPFTVEWNADNFAHRPDYIGPHPTWVAGHWALLKPLSEGEHVIELGGALCGELDGVVTFETGVTYTITVEDEDCDDDDDDDDDDD